MKSVMVSSVLTCTNALSLFEVAAALPGSAKPSHSPPAVAAPAFPPPAPVQLGRAMPRPPDALIRPAAADAIAHRLVDIGVAGVRGLSQQRRRGHDLPGLAVAALRHVLFDPRTLDGMRALRREAFDG